jgi:sugar lactone lactonase YvrE
MQDTDLRVVADVHADVGEGPCWDAAKRVVRFVDISPGLVYRYDPSDGSVDSRALGQEVSAVIPRTQGGLVVAMRDGIAFVDERDGTLDLVAPIELENPGNRMNDAKCDPAGRLWAGTMAFDFAPGAAALYRIAPDLSFVKVLEGVTISNGLGWSPDGDVMYYVDSGKYSVDAFDYDGANGEIANRRELIRFAPEDGMPDGMAVDADGHLWIAFFHAAAVRRYTPQGRLDRQIRLPVALVTSVTFGGDDLRDLYITSAAYELSAEQLAEQPHAGATFVCRPGVEGQPTVPFAG